MQPSMIRDAGVAPLTIALLGATSGVGAAVCSQATRAGHRVVALTRDPARLPENPRVRAVVGDAMAFDDVRRTVAGCHAVVCALGAPALSGSRARSEGVRHALTAMAEAGIERLICVSVLGAGDSRDLLPWHLRYLMFPLYLRRAVADHERQEALIRSSATQWTIVRPPFLTDGPPRRAYRHGFGDDVHGLSLKVSRADVADFVLDELAESRYPRRCVGISDARD